MKASFPSFGLTTVPPLGTSPLDNGSLAVQFNCMESVVKNQKLTLPEIQDALAVLYKTVGQ